MRRMLASQAADPNSPRGRASLESPNGAQAGVRTACPRGFPPIAGGAHGRCDGAAVPSWLARAVDIVPRRHEAHAPPRRWRVQPPITASLGRPLARRGRRYAAQHAQNRDTGTTDTMSPAAASSAIEGAPCTSRPCGVLQQHEARTTAHAGSVSPNLNCDPPRPRSCMHLSGARAGGDACQSQRDSARGRVPSRVAPRAPGLAARISVLQIPSASEMRRGARSLHPPRAESPGQLRFPARAHTAPTSGRVASLRRVPGAARGAGICPALFHSLPLRPGSVACATPLRRDGD